jgi:hypothetical protein
MSLKKVAVLKPKHPTKHATKRKAAKPAKKACRPIKH